MITYRIINLNDKSQELIFGINNENNHELINKFNNGVSKICPYEECVPYYKGCTFSFSNMNALKYFLYGLCKFSIDEVKEFLSLGYTIVEEELDVYSKGLSGIICTKFDDEILYTKDINIDKMITNNDNYIAISKAYATSSEKRFCKERYYTNVTFIY